MSLALILLGLVGGAVVATRRARTAEAAASARELGRGGMGVVFEAVDEKLKRSVALKQLQGDYRSVEDGGLFLVFELVRGRSLDAVLGAGVSAEQARGIVARACTAT